MESFIATKDLVSTMSKVINRMGGLFTRHTFTYKGEGYKLAVHIPSIELIEEESLLNTYKASITYLLVDKEDVLHPISSGTIVFSLPEYLTNDSKGVSYILFMILSNNVTRELYAEFEMEAKNFLNDSRDPDHIVEGIDHVLESLSMDRGRIGDGIDG